jgi:hypothetical protein
VKIELMEHPWGRVEVSSPARARRGVRSLLLHLYMIEAFITVALTNQIHPRLMGSRTSTPSPRRRPRLATPRSFAASCALVHCSRGCTTAVNRRDSPPPPRKTAHQLPLSGRACARFAPGRQGRNQELHCAQVHDGPHPLAPPFGLSWDARSFLFSMVCLCWCWLLLEVIERNPRPPSSTRARPPRRAWRPLTARDARRG